MSLSNFQSRLIIGAIYVALTVSMLLWDQLSAWAYIGVIAFFCLYEFYQITTSLSVGLRWVNTFAGLFIFGMVVANQDEGVNVGNMVYYIVPLVLLVLTLMLRTDQEKFLSNAFNTIGGWVYIGLPLGYLARTGNLVFDEANTELLPYYGNQILALFVLVWLNDTFAYLSGKAFGKNPLWKSVSPKKTIEGFLGGLVATCLVSYFLMSQFIDLPQLQLLILAVIVVVAGTIGDLFESQIKRSLSLKDSGTALGGHGGFLDRFDSILFAAPLFYAYLKHFVVM